MMLGKQIVFIAGSGHSGSTLLDMCLGGHPDVAALGETGFLYFYARKMGTTDVCTCGKTVEECPFWSKTIARLAEMRDLKKEDVLKDFILSDPDQVRFDENGDYRERLPHERRINFSLLRPLVGVAGSGALFRAAAKVSDCMDTRLRAAGNRMLLLEAVLSAHDKAVALDSTKSPGTIKEAWMLRGETPVKFIVMHRDGRGVAASHMRRLGVTLPQAATIWRNEIVKWWAASCTIPKKNILAVRYEDFAADPARELRRICGFIGIAFTQDMLSFRDNRHNIGGNRMRFRRGETEIRLDERWKKDLTREQLEDFERISGWVNRRLGYGP